MKLRPFIFIYSATLLAWLGLTYVTPQPAQRYRPSSPASAKTAAPKQADPSQAENPDRDEERSVSASR